MACQTSPEEKCEESHHIITDNIKEKDEVGSLLHEISTHLITAVTTREQLQSDHLNVKVEKLEEKLIQAKSEQAENRSCIEELRSKIENCMENKYLSSECSKNTKGLAIKENLKGTLDQAKEEASKAILLLLNREGLQSPTPVDIDVWLFYYYAFKNSLLETQH